MYNKDSQSESRKKEEPMSIGLKRGTVFLEPHQAAWEQTARETIRTLRSILSDVAADIQHVGSTSVKTIGAKPIIDIAVAANDLDALLSKREELEQKGFLYRGEDVPGQLLFVMGDDRKDTRTHHIHVVRTDSEAWKCYLRFRDYLNGHLCAAKEYEEVKRRLAEQFPDDRTAYSNGKQEIIQKLLAEAAVWSSAYTPSCESGKAEKNA